MQHAMVSAIAVMLSCPPTLTKGDTSAATTNWRQPSTGSAVPDTSRARCTASADAFAEHQAHAHSPKNAR
jgi:hypothetical protein